MNLSCVRMLRMLRIARMVRLLKVFKALWLIVTGIINSLKPIFWAGILLFVILYVFGIFLVKVIPSTAPTEPVDYHPDWDAYQYFGNMRLAMFSLFEVTLDPLFIR